MIIWKFPLQIKNEQKIEMPSIADPLDVQMQVDTLMLWALVDETSEKVERTIYIYGTGNPMPDNFDKLHIGTFQTLGGAAVFHVFRD